MFSTNKGRCCQTDILNEDSVLLNCWFVDMHWSTANSYWSKKLLLPKVFYFLKLVGKGDSKDKKLSERERTETITLILSSISKIFIIIYLWYDIYVSVF
jgi:hypothetical protein